MNNRKNDSNEIFRYIHLFTLGVLSFIILFDYFNKFSICMNEIISTICQIVTTVMCSVMSILCISITIQNETIYGVSRRKFDNLRRDIHFSVKRIIITTIIFSFICIITYLFHLYVSCLFTSFFMILFGLAACICEIPIMCREETKILNVIRKSLKYCIISGKDLPSDLKLIIQNIVTEDYTIKSLYKVFNENENSSYNEKLLIKLLEIHCDYCFELSKLEETIKNIKAERILKNIEDILSFKDDYNIIEITNNKIFYYLHLISNVLFKTYEIKSTNRKTIHLIIDNLPFIDGYKRKEQRKFFLMIALRMISISVTSSDLNLVYELKRVCSNWKYSLNRGGALTTIFALISMHLVYLCNSAVNVPQELIQQIKKFIEDSSLLNDNKTMSWVELYSIFLDEFSLEVEEFINFFKMNDGYWDMKIFDYQAHIIVFDERYALKWFFANLFSSYSATYYDYNQLLEVNFEFSDTLMHVGDEILNNSSTKREILKFVTFYLKDKNFIYFDSEEEYEGKFRTFISNLHKKVINDLIKDIKSGDKIKMANEFQNNIINSIKSQLEYCEDFNLDEMSLKIYKIIFEFKSFSINYNEVLTEYLINQIKHEIVKNITIKKIEYSDMFELKKYLKGYKKICVSETHKNKAIKILKANELSEKMDIIVLKNSILSEYYTICNEIIKFGINIVINIEELSKKQILEKVEEYKVNDSRYIYEGAILSREELESIVAKQYAVLELKLKYKINCENAIVYQIVNKK